MTDETTITITFPDKETVDYVNLVCRRKGIDLAAYIVDNFEWDDKPACFYLLEKGEKITEEVCKGCDHLEYCPDKAGKKMNRCPLTDTDCIKCKFLEDLQEWAYCEFFKQAKSISRMRVCPYGRKVVTK